MACCNKFNNLPSGERLEAEVYRSLLDTKVKQLDWALGEMGRAKADLSRAAIILAAVCDASSIDEYRAARVHADAFLAKLLAAEKEARS